MGHAVGDHFAVAAVAISGALSATLAVANGPVDGDRTDYRHGYALPAAPKYPPDSTP